MAVARKTTPVFQDVITREDIPLATPPRVDGEERDVGIVRNFHDHPQLHAFLPSSFFMSWVGLGANGILEPHAHEVTTAIVIASGSASLLGQDEGFVTAGSYLQVPEHHVHGFKAQTDGLSGLNWYEASVDLFNPDQPLTWFSSDKRTEAQVNLRGNVWNESLEPAHLLQDEKTYQVTSLRARSGEEQHGFPSSSSRLVCVMSGAAEWNRHHRVQEGDTLIIAPWDAWHLQALSPLKLLVFDFFSDVDRNE